MKYKCIVCWMEFERNPKESKDLKYWNDELGWSDFKDDPEHVPGICSEKCMKNHYKEIGIK